MANGEPFNENALTLAFMDTPLNVWVKVRNLVTGLEAMGRVTDRGGFKMQDRIADLSLGLARQIGLQTDHKVEISMMSC
jgi:rare lipoprotein A